MAKPKFSIFFHNRSVFLECSRLILHTPRRLFLNSRLMLRKIRSLSATKHLNCKLDSIRKPPSTDAFSFVPFTLNDLCESIWWKCRVIGNAGRNNHWICNYRNSDGEYLVSPGNSAQWQPFLLQLIITKATPPMDDLWLRQRKCMYNRKTESA